MKYGITLILYVVLQFVAFLLLLVGTPLDMFRKTKLTGYGTVKCITLWGVKENCASLDYDLTIYLFFSSCETRTALFRIAQSFAVISVLVYGAAFSLGFAMLFWCHFLRLVCLVLNVVGAITLCVVWAIVVTVFHRMDGPLCVSLRDFHFVFGTGFFFLVLAWCLDTLNIIILLLPCTVSATTDNEKTEPPTAQE
ncbi:amastin-like surface protein, putative [Leishmania donovani]|uniref:Amastin-like surface protein, putative n=1 Tax=Leishmania donovani TaxID=5661 RepID=A0A3S7X7Y0_LEIDO|nr:amastin-like surface protein, putative [Leishmania donovani]